MGSLFVVMSVAVLAPLLALAFRRWRVPSVVLEITLGIVIGPQVLGLAEENAQVEFLAAMGLGFLLFLAGYEIDLRRVRGRPVNLALWGWALSLVLGLGVAAVLVVEGLVLSDLLVGLALTTTALGTLLPILRDSGVLDTPMGPYILAIGSVGEFGPIVWVALFFGAVGTAESAALLLVFVAISLATAAVSMRARQPRVVSLLQQHLHSSSQLPVRLAIFLLVLLMFVAGEFGLDSLLGAFAAGLIVREIAGTGDGGEVVRIKLEAIGFGFLIPVFMVATGLTFDLDALLASPSGLLRLPLFVALFLVVRGVPALLLYRKAVPRGDLLPLAFFSATALPLVVAITEIGLETGDMTPVTAAALVGAAMASVMVFPLVALALRSRSGTPDEVAAPAAAAAAAEP